MATGRSAKRKGAKGEREVCGILSELLGFEVKRRLGAARSGGDDTADIPGWSIEIKRVEREKLPKWWRQTLDQSQRYDKKPCLLFRPSGQPWRAVVRMKDVLPAAEYHENETVIMSLVAFAALVKFRAPRRVSRDS